jgi:OmcA/MtrC family decaheme c-type cytochrome
MLRLAALSAVTSAFALAACAGDDGAGGKSGTAGEPGPAGKDGQPGNEGGTGQPGAPALMKSSDEPAGTNCPNGGTKVEVGVDKNGNGALDQDEITSTAYVCNGTGSNSLVATSAEPAGTNCEWGGVKIETGLDANGNGVLDPSEVDAAATTFACNMSPSGTVVPTRGLNVVIGPGDVSTSTTGPVTVRFRLKDDNGYPVDLAGKFSVNTPISPRFALAYFTKDTAGKVSPLKVYSKTTSATVAQAQPTMYSPSSTGQGTLTENGVGAGDYTYTFPAADTDPGARAVAYDATKLAETHVVWITAGRQTDLVFTTNANTFFAANQSFYFVPDGSGTPVKREIVGKENCSKCHNGFRPETTTSATFHGGTRVDPTLCNVCHNPERVNQAANSASYVHRIHYGDHIRPANRFRNLAATYPQDIRNCDACHKGTENGAQAQTALSRLACGSCHDYVKFDGSAAASCTKPRALDTDPTSPGYGYAKDCNHTGMAQTDDSGCTGCHNAASIANAHRPVIKPDPNNALLLGTGGSSSTNAAHMAAAGYVPTGASVITYEIKSVSTWEDTSVTPSVKRPQIAFKFKKDGAAVAFQDSASASELMDGFVGSPSVYFAFAVPQDGIEKPADFNATTSAYIKNVWNGTLATAEWVGADSEGFYTIKLKNAVIPANATMLTGAIGYSYNLSSAFPLTQINVAGYPYTASNKQGGLIVSTPNVWKVATGYTGRRPIVEAARCNDCHGALGVAPSFHGGQRNDGPTCSFCHNNNRTSSGWAVGSKSYIHAIHAGRIRSTDFNWYAASPTKGFWEIEFPNQLNNCKACHLPNTYDFTASASMSALPNMTPQTVATGTLSSTSATSYRFSPYIETDKAYGSNFSFSAATGVATQAAPTTLVSSPIMAVCASCHDSTPALAHMQQAGGSFYKPRSEYKAGQEQCMMCHGPGKIVAIGEVHQK